MGDLINLNRFRKRRQLDQAASVAEQNAIKHGRTKVERGKADLERSRQQEHLDGAELDDSDPSR